jgi:hypothetical protein
MMRNGNPTIVEWADVGIIGHKVDIRFIHPVRAKTIALQIGYQKMLTFLKVDFQKNKI